jgi:hypothetical protein
MVEVSRRRPTRASETAQMSPVHPEVHEDEWEHRGLLDTRAIPERPGYTRRWIRTKLQGEDDPNRVATALNQGWRPIKADTLPKEAFVATVNFGNWGNVVGIDGMILMERALPIHEAEARHVRGLTNHQMEAVENELFRVHKPGTRGFGAPRVVDRHTTVRTGRRVEVAEDAD